MRTITDRDITDQVTEAIGPESDGIDVAGIVAEIISEHGLIDIDDIPSDAFWTLVARHDAGK